MNAASSFVHFKSTATVVAWKLGRAVRRNPWSAVIAFDERT